MSQYFVIKNDNGGGADKPADDGLAGTVRKLSSTALSTSAAGKQDIYTVPAGKKLVISHLVFHSVVGADAPNLSEFIGLGYDTNNLLSQVPDVSIIHYRHIAYAAEGKFTIMSFATFNGSYTWLSTLLGNAGQTLGVCNYNTSIEVTYRLDLFGYLIDA